MTHDFDKDYWEGHWQQGADAMERNRSTLTWLKRSAG